MTGPERSIAERQRHPRPREAPGGEPEAMRVWLLGGFRVSVGARVVGEREWRLRKAGSLVRLLALAEKHRLHREQVMDLLWPDLGEKPAANNLYRALHFARRALEPGAGSVISRYLSLRGDLITLSPEGPLWVDVEAFEEAARAARLTREPAAYQSALDLYPGDLLPEDRYETWAEERRNALRETHLTLLVELAGLHEERGEHAPAIEALSTALGEDPSREEVRRGLMRLFAASGERRRAIAQYEQLEKTLSEKFGAEPVAASRRLYEEILAGRYRSGGESRSLEQPAKPKHNLPNPRTSFVGRQQEMVEVKRLLAMTGVLTVTGTGGCGKTRLSLEVARDLVAAYPDGVWLVRLAALSDPVLVPQAVAQALGAREQPGRALTETLSKHLGSRRTLLILDNCEHLIEACARLVDALLDSCPGLRVLCTSREALGVMGETTWPLSPLALPDAGERLPPVEELARYESVVLFLEHARSRLSDFELNRENAQGIAEVCRKLDGIPLGIELAAARLSALAVKQVVAKLNDSLNILTTTSGRTREPRHRTLRATLQWSYELLDEPEKRLFERLSVFAGSWTLEAAEEVCSGEGIEQDDILDLLSKLVDKSLVVAERRSDRESRYRMLEPIRQYGRGRLEESKEAEQVRERHAEHYLALAEGAEPDLMGPRPSPCLERLKPELGNFRAALSWSLDTSEESEERAQIGLRLATALGRFWDAQGPREGRRWLEKGLAKGGVPISVRAKALNEAGFTAVYEGDPRAMTLLEESLDLYKESGDRLGVAYAIANLGHAVVHLGHRERMLSLREEVKALLSEPLDKRTSAHLLLFLGFAAASEMDYEEWEARIGDSLALFRELEDIRGIAMCLPSLGYTCLYREDSEQAAALFEEGLVLQRELKFQTAIFMGVSGMVGVAALRGQRSRAAKLLGASEAIREFVGLSFTSSSKADWVYERCFSAARTGLSEEAFEAAFSEGQAMSLEQAMEYALSAEEPASLAASKPRRTRTDEPASLLSPRQREVATLVARGLTNVQIAETLAISKNTVDNHVARIISKLNLPSRSRIAVWVTERKQIETE